MLTNKVRIIGGKWRGRRLKFPSVPGLRPTLDRMKETLFNWLMHDIANTHCLDLFAGSGAMGLESLSRGANHVIFVDNSKKVIEQLKSNCENLACTNQCEIFEEDALHYLNHIEKTFDIIFVDPPFRQNLVMPCCETIIKRNSLNPKSYIYIETELESLELPNALKIIKQMQTDQVYYYLVRYNA